MKFKEFIGIDVSKSKIDVFIYSVKAHAVFDNNEFGFKRMIKWMNNHLSCTTEELLFAFEHTGIYSLHLSVFLDENEYKFTIIPGLELKKSRGIARGKADNIDARAIAEYAYEKRERIKLYQMPGKILMSLKRLVTYREQLVKQRTGLKAGLKEYNNFLDQDQNQVLFDSYKEMIDVLNEHVKTVEKEMYKLIKEDKELAKQYSLVTSIKGIGPQTALTMLVLTNGFTLFDNWRKFASYSGSAPFPNQSGNFRGKTKVSHLANKRMKTLLTNCAGSAIQFNPEMKLYYDKRVSEGKNEMSTMNIIRNKLISRAFAVIKRGTPYVDTYGFAT